MTQLINTDWIFHSRYRVLRLALAKVLRGAAVELSKQHPKARYGCCFAIDNARFPGHHIYATGYLKQEAKEYFYKLYLPHPCSAYFWSFSARSYNQREARIFALLLAAESLEQP